MVLALSMVLFRFNRNQFTDESKEMEVNRLVVLFKITILVGLLGLHLGIFTHGNQAVVVIEELMQVYFRKGDPGSEQDQ